MLTFSGAHSSCYIINEEEVRYVKGSRYSIGEYSQRVENVVNTQFQIKPKDRLFMYTDGIIDQFGGEENKKFGRKRLEKLLQSTFSLPIEEQKSKLADCINTWKKGFIQTDDMLLVGIEF